MTTTGIHQGLHALPFVTALINQLKARHRVRVETMVGKIRKVQPMGFGSQANSYPHYNPHFVSDDGLITLVAERIVAPDTPSMVEMIIDHPKFVEGIVNARDSMQVIVGVVQL